MKKTLFILCLMLFFAFLFPANAFAEDVDILHNDFTDWLGSTPYDWDFESMGDGWMEEGSGTADITLNGYGYALMRSYITLEPSCAYRISVPVEYYDVESDGVGVNVNINGQYADAGYLHGTGSDTIELYVSTNVDDLQDYILRIGLGNEDSYATGSVSVDSVTITRLEELPDGVYSYSLIGSAGLMDLDSYEEPEETVNEYASVADYNTAGIVLVGILFTLLLYFVFTGRWANRFSARISNFYFLLGAFLIAFFLRTYMSAHSTGHFTDLNCFKAWAVNLQSYGLSGFYESGIFADYMPGYYYVLYVLGGIYNLLGLEYDSSAYTYLIELVPILCDLLLAYAAYAIVAKKHNRQLASLAAVFLLYAPFVFTDSAVWGQIDSVFTLALLGCIWLLSEDKKFFACLLWAVALMIKPQALLAAPVVAMVFLKDLFTKGKTLRTLIEAVLSLAGIAAAVLLISLPMKGSQPFYYVVTRMIETTGQYAYATVNCFNLYGIFGGNFLADSGIFVAGVSYKTFGWCMILLSTLFTGWLVFRAEGKKHIFSISGLYLALICLFAHNMHERYIYPAVVLLLIGAFLQDSRRLFFSAAALGALLFANMEIVLAFRQELIYPWITRLFSLLAVFAGLYALYAVLSAVLNKPSHGILLTEEPIESLKTSREAAAARRLRSAPHVDRRMKKKDWLIMLLITAIYGVISLTNLGSTEIPRQTELLPEDFSDPIIIELSEESYINEFKYYTGYCSGSFRVSTSLDGFRYEEIYYGEITHEHANMFRWYSYPIEDYANYIRIEKTSGTLELREIGFFDANNELLSLESSNILSLNSANNAPQFIDEQHLVPATTSYMTEMYFDEVYHARTAYEYIHGIYPYEITHPPLGKAFIALGILLFGMNPFGWRFAGALAGILMLPVLYIFAKRIFRKTKWAAVSTILFAADFMHHTLSRIATIDSFTMLFILLMYLCMYEYTQHNFLTEKLSRTFLPLGLCGLFFALGAATKWISLYAGMGLAILFFYTVYQRAAEYRLLRAKDDPRSTYFRKKLILTLLFCVGVFIILPVTIYCISYLPYEWASPEGFGIRGILDNQEYMFNYHGYLTTDSPHPYSSQWQTWPFSIRPVFFFLGSGLASGRTALIWCMGNPLLWWSAIAAFFFILGKRRPERHFDLRGLGFLLVAALCQLAPNLLITREMFLYHYFTLVPFFCMGIVYVLKYAEEHLKYGKTITTLYIVLICLLFAAFYPLITGIEIPYDYGKALQWISTWPI